MFNLSSSHTLIIMQISLAAIVLFGLSSIDTTAWFDLSANFPELNK